MFHCHGQGETQRQICKMMKANLIVIIFVMTIKEFLCFRLTEDLDYLTGFHLGFEDEFFKICEEEARGFDESTGRYIEITSSILQLIYSLIGKTGHSAKSLELARQMNVSITYTFSPPFPPSPQQKKTRKIF